MGVCFCHLTLILTSLLAAFLEGAKAGVVGIGIGLCVGLVVAMGAVLGMNTFLRWAVRHPRFGVQYSKPVRCALNSLLFILVISTPLVVCGLATVITQTIIRLR